MLRCKRMKIYITEWSMHVAHSPFLLCGTKAPPKVTLQSPQWLIRPMGRLWRGLAESQ